MIKRSFFPFFGALLFVASLFMLEACRDNTFITDADATLAFSVDTLRFDTVFTELGSATRILKIYNRHSQPIQISHIKLKDNAFAVFNFNVDGVSSNEVTNVEIAANDSMYVFAEVTINPDLPLTASPFVIGGELEFETNGNLQTVRLEAWGQNANYVPSRWSKGGFALLNQDATWDDAKPYVIYGVLFIDSCTLTLPAGAQVFVHGGIAKLEDGSLYNDGIIYVLSEGKLKIEGTPEKPVTIQSDRLESEFDDISGQWAGIVLSGGSTGNTFNFAQIKHSIVGVRVDSAATLQVRNSLIAHTASSGILGIHSTIVAENCLVFDNGTNSFQGEYGGNYDFKYCTLANFGNNAPALRLTNALCLDEFCNEFMSFPLVARFKNCIVYGSQSDEVALFDRLGGAEPALFDYQLENCIVRVKDLLKEDAYPTFLTEHCQPCQNANSTMELFRDASNYDFHPDTLSIAKQYAVPISGIDRDLENMLRDLSTPDAGCYEANY